MTLEQAIVAWRAKIFEMMTCDPPISDSEDYTEYDRASSMRAAEDEVARITTGDDCYGYIHEMLCGDTHEALAVMLSCVIEDWDDLKFRGIKENSNG